MRPSWAIVCCGVAGSFACTYFLWRRICALEKRLLHSYFAPESIVMLRHGESQANVDPARYGPAHNNEDFAFGDPNVCLTVDGIKQEAQEVGDELAQVIGSRLVFMYVSPYERTRQTAKLVQERLSAKGVQVFRIREDPRLREREFCGSFQHSEVSREEESAYSRFYWRPPSGESCADVYDRITTFIDTLWRDMRGYPQMQGAVVLVVSHGLTCRILAMRWLRWSPEYFGLTRNLPNCGFISLVRVALQGSGCYQLDRRSLALLGLA